MSALQGPLFLNRHAAIRRTFALQKQSGLLLILVSLASIPFAAIAANPIQFAPPIDFDLGHTPICAGDFNGDGFPDLAMGYTNGTVAILTNDGTGALRLSTSFSVNGGVKLLAVSDINGDNKLDLVAAGGYASICLNSGDGSFAVTNLPPYLNATALAVGDFNRDHRPDIAIVGYNLAIFLAQSNGAFMPPAYYSGSGGYSYQAIAAADFDGNTRSDLVLTAWAPSNTLVRFSNADGTFASPIGYPGGGNGLDWHYCVVAADLDNDGKLDLITGNLDDLSLSVRLNNGDGTFGPENRIHLPNVPNSLDQLAVADFDGDGIPDIVVGTPLMIFPGLGHGLFAPPVTNITGLYVNGKQTLAVADFDGDGRPDIATASVTNNAVSILFNRTPPPINLSIQYTAGLLVLNWPDKPGFKLEFITNLALPNAWSIVTNSSFAVDGQRIVVTSAGGGQGFFRLRQH
jgi:hypothetical protein